MIIPICGTCNIERRIGSHGGENGVEIVIMAGQRKYKAYRADKWVCPICGNIEYHTSRDADPFWAEWSGKPAPDAVPIWETVKDAQAALKPTFDYVVSVWGGAGNGVLAIKNSLSAAKEVIEVHLDNHIKRNDHELYKESLLPINPPTHCLQYRLTDNEGIAALIRYTFYITVLERGVG